VLQDRPGGLGTALDLEQVDGRKGLAISERHRCGKTDDDDERGEIHTGQTDAQRHGQLGVIPLSLQRGGVLARRMSLEMNVST